MYQSSTSTRRLSVYRKWINYNYLLYYRVPKYEISNRRLLYLLDLYIKSKSKWFNSLFQA